MFNLCLFLIPPFHYRVPRGSVVKCLTRNLGVLGSSRTGSSGFFRGSVLGQDTSEPSLVLVKPRKDMNNVSCRRDMTEILLKAALNTIQSINQPFHYPAIYSAVDHHAERRERYQIFHGSPRSTRSPSVYSLAQRSVAICSERRHIAT